MAPMIFTAMALAAKMAAPPKKVLFFWDSDKFATAFPGFS